MQDGIRINSKKEMNRSEPGRFPFLAYKQIQESLRQMTACNEQLRAAKEKAEQREQRKTAFFANMICEIRTPVNIIKSFVEFLEQSSLSVSDREEYARIVEQCINELALLVNDLLDMARLEAGKLSVRERPGKLSVMLDELYEVFSLSSYRLETVQLQTCLRLSHEQNMVYADFTKLRQVLVNLIANALKFTTSGYVRFGCCLKNKETLLFFVQDTGEGIAPEVRNTIFEPLRQEDIPHSVPEHQEFGLRLAIVKSLVELLQGKVWVKSEPGKGSTFYFTIPFKMVEQ